MLLFDAKRENLTLAEEIIYNSYLNSEFSLEE